MPAHAHYFMVEYLRKLRLHFDWSVSLTDSIIGSVERADYNTLTDPENSFYTSQIKDSGYHSSFLANLFLVILVAGIIFVVWLLAIVKDWCYRVVASSKKPRKNRSEPFWTNFELRFLYEITFEICLCSILYLAIYDSGADTSVIIFAITLISIIGIAMLLLFCFSLSYRNGPYLNSMF